MKTNRKIRFYLQFNKKWIEKKRQERIAVYKAREDDPKYASMRQFLRALYNSNPDENCPPGTLFALNTKDWK